MLERDHARARNIAEVVYTSALQQDNNKAAEIARKQIMLVAHLEQQRILMQETLGIPDILDTDKQPEVPVESIAEFPKKDSTRRAQPFFYGYGISDPEFDLTLRYLNLPMGVENALKRADLRNVDLIACTPDQDLIAIRGLGRKGLKSIHSQLSIHQDLIMTQQQRDEYQKAREQEGKVATHLERIFGQDQLTGTEKVEELLTGYLNTRGITTTTEELTGLNGFMLYRPADSPQLPDTELGEITLAQKLNARGREAVLARAIAHLALNYPAYDITDLGKIRVRYDHSHFQELPAKWKPRERHIRQWAGNLISGAYARLSIGSINLLMEEN